MAIRLTDGQVKFTLPDGKSEVRQMKTGNPKWTPAGKHLPEDIGSKAFELILVELRGKAGAAQPHGKAAAKSAKKSGEQKGNQELLVQGGGPARRPVPTWS